MGVFDDLGEAFSDGADAIGDGAEAVVDAVDEAINDGEEAIGEATEEAGKWFLEEILGASDEYMTDGGSEVDNNEFEERATIGSSSSELDVVRVIPYDPSGEYGYDNRELTLVPSRFTSRLRETDASDREPDGVHSASDGAIGTTDDLETETSVGTHRSEERENVTGGAGSETRSETGGDAIGGEYSANRSDSLQYIAPTDDTLAETSTGREATTQHTPAWTNFNDGDPSSTLADGGWMEDVSLFRDGTSRYSDRGSTSRESTTLVDADTTHHSSYATTLEDASSTSSLSWLH